MVLLRTIYYHHHHRVVAGGEDLGIKAAILVNRERSSTYAPSPEAGYIYTIYYPIASMGVWQVYGCMGSSERVTS